MCGALPPTLNGTLKYCNNMEYWNIRILGKWNIGGHLGAWSQVYWYIGILVYWNGILVYWYIGILQIELVAGTLYIANVEGPFDALDALRMRRWQHQSQSAVETIIQLYNKPIGILVYT